MKNLSPALRPVCLLLVSTAAARAQQPALVVQTGHSAKVDAAALSPDGRLLYAPDRDRIQLRVVATGALLGSLVPLAEADWAVVTPAGQFDGSGEGFRMMHWVVGREAIELAQLKDRYYEPNLLAKLAGFNREPLRDVSALRDVKLFPAVEFTPPPASSSSATSPATRYAPSSGSRTARASTS